MLKMLQALFYHIELASTGRHDGTGLPGTLKSPVFWLLAVVSLVALLLRAAIWGGSYEWLELIVANLAVIAIIRANVRKDVFVQAVACFLLVLIAHEAIFVLIGWLPKEIRLGIDAVTAIILMLDISGIEGE